MIDQFVSADRKTIAIDVFSNERSGDSDVKSLLGKVRAVAMSNAAPGWQVSVGGVAAVEYSAAERISHATPLVIATMLAVIYLLLVLTFRSLLLPCKAIALNLLSVGAAMGAVVLIFQHGFLADALGIASVGPIQTFVPILLVAVLFSLSTDYEVFLLSRVRERYEQTGDNTESVVYGLVETAPLISGAALLMATIFAAFVVIPLVSVQQMGLSDGHRDRNRRHDRQARHGAGGHASDGPLELVAASRHRLLIVARSTGAVVIVHQARPTKKVCNAFLEADAVTVEVSSYHRRVERAGKSRRHPPQ